MLLELGFGAQTGAFIFNLLQADVEAGERIRLLVEMVHLAEWQGDRVRQVCPQGRLTLGETYGNDGLSSTGVLIIAKKFKLVILALDFFNHIIAILFELRLVFCA